MSSGGAEDKVALTAEGGDLHLLLSGGCCDQGCALMSLTRVVWPYFIFGPSKNTVDVASNTRES